MSGNKYKSAPALPSLEVRELLRCCLLLWLQGVGVLLLRCVVKVCLRAGDIGASRL